MLHLIGGASPLAAFYCLATLALLAWCARDLVVAVGGTHAFTKDVLTATLQRTHELHLVQALARHRLRWAVTIYALALGYAYAFELERANLVALRSAARMQPVPFRCLGNQDYWQLSPTERFWESLRSAEEVEQRCATYLAHLDLDTMPNVLAVLADTLLVVPLRWALGVGDGVGQALAHFLSHFPFVLQLALLVCCALALLGYLSDAPARWLGLLLTWRNAPQQRQQRNSKLKIEELTSDDDVEDSNAMLVCSPAPSHQQRLTQPGYNGY